MTHGEIDFQTAMMLFYFELKFIAITSDYHPGFVDHIFEVITPHDNHYEMIYSMQNKGIKSAIQQIELNQELKRVNQGNYLAKRLYLN